MARPVHPLEISKEQFYLLRSVLYNQQLPASLVRSPVGILLVSDEMVRRKFLQRIGHKFELTVRGKAALSRYSGGRAPMIDVTSKWLLDRSPVNCQYQVGSSLADQLAMRVSGDE